MCVCLVLSEDVHDCVRRCEGGDLFSKIVQEGKYSEKRAVRCCRQLADALQWIHKRGVTHRDLKVRGRSGVMKRGAGKNVSDSCVGLVA
jgi:serine/threonine protein kinase